jgi:murein DD-endopeptidase MepM/ murein hydrolase activator NlpD
VVGGFGDLYYSLLEFDLGGMPPNASSAKLELFAFPQRGVGTTGMYLDRITEFWDWKTMGTGSDFERLWWADRPAAVQWIPGALPAPIEGQWYSIDITDLYNAWQNGTYPNYGLQLRPVSTNNQWNEFYSADFLDDPSRRPKLVVEAFPPALIWPVPSGFTSKPGQDYAQFNDGSANRHHAGLDIPAPLGTRVVAAADGTVRVFRLVDFDQKTHCLGNVVIIDHDGLAATLYAHLQTISVSDGQTVSQEQQIGEVGDTLGLTANDGSCGTTGAHLHFELKNNAVLGTTSDDGTTWGYTPEGPVSPVNVDNLNAGHPDNYGFHDPVLNLHSGITDTTEATVVVTSLGAGVSMRTGPGADKPCDEYRCIGSTLQPRQRFTRIREYSPPTPDPNCSRGWYQIKKIDGSYFPDSISDGSLPEVWVCRGNGTEVWVNPVVPMPWLNLLLLDD